MQFDEKTAQFLNRCYDGRDFRARRKANLDALAPRTGETIVDIGCGAGHLTEELAITGARVIGVDPSAAMRETARTRCASFEVVSIVDGTADELPVGDGAADGAVSIQVFEYLSDIPAALDEVARILRPGGRLVIGDMHFGTMVWPTDDPDLGREVLALYDRHFVTGRAPELVQEALPGAGFTDITVTPLTFTDIEARSDGMAGMMLQLVPSYLRGLGTSEGALGDAWRADQEGRLRAGRFFFSATHMVVSARRI